MDKSFAGATGWFFLCCYCFSVERYSFKIVQFSLTYIIPFNSLAYDFRQKIYHPVALLIGIPYLQVSTF